MLVWGVVTYSVKSFCGRGGGGLLAIRQKFLAKNFMKLLLLKHGVLPSCLHLFDSTVQYRIKLKHNNNARG